MAALQALRRLVNPGGRVLLGEGFWERPPAAAELAAMWPGTTAGEFRDLAGLVDLVVDAGLRPAWIEVASREEWDDFESGYQCDEEEWLAAHGDHPQGRLDPGTTGSAPVVLAARLPRDTRPGLPHPGPAV